MLISPALFPISIYVFWMEFVVGDERKPRVEDSHAGLQQPQQGRIQRPPEDLRLGPANAQGILL